MTRCSACLMLISIAGCSVLPEIVTTAASVYGAYRAHTVSQKIELVSECPRWVVTFPRLTEQEKAALTRAVKEHIVAFNAKVREFCARPDPQ